MLRLHAIYPDICSLTAINLYHSCLVVRMHAMHIMQCAYINTHMLLLFYQVSTHTHAPQSSCCSSPSTPFHAYDDQTSTLRAWVVVDAHDLIRCILWSHVMASCVVCKLYFTKDFWNREGCELFVVNSSTRISWHLWLLMNPLLPSTLCFCYNKTGRQLHKLRPRNRFAEVVLCNNGLLLVVCGPLKLFHHCSCCNSWLGTSTWLMACPSCSCF